MEDWKQQESAGRLCTTYKLKKKHVALSVWYEEYGFTSGVTSLLTSGVCFVVTFILLFVFYVRLATEKKENNKSLQWRDGIVLQTSLMTMINS